MNIFKRISRTAKQLKASKAVNGTTPVSTGETLLHKCYKKYSLTAVIASIITAVICYALVCSGAADKFIPQLVLAEAFLILIYTIAAMGASLNKTLKVTLFAYKNIGLISGIIFISVFAYVLLFCFVSCLYTGDMSLSYIYDLVIKFPRRFSLYAVLVMAVICIMLVISNISLMRHEGIRPKNAFGIFLAVFYIGGVLAVYLIAKLFENTGIFGKNAFSVVFGISVPVFLFLMMCYFECVFFGAVIMGWRAVHKKPKHDKDYIIILGCSIDKKGGLLPLLKGRVNAAIRFAWDQELDTGKPALYVPSGGKGENEIMSEGSAMELYLMTRGAEAYEIFPEKASLNTWENFCFSKKIIDSLKPDARIAFATTNYHILRSGILARRAGIDAEGITGDTKWYFWPNGFIREYFGILTLKFHSHITVAAVMAVISVLLGVIGLYSGFIVA